MDRIQLDRKTKTMILRWLEQGFASVGEIGDLYCLTKCNPRNMTDEEIVQEMMRIEEETDGAITGGYRLRYVPERFERITNSK